MEGRSLPRMAQRRRRIGPSPAGRRLLAAVAGLVVAAAVLPGCQDEEPTSGDPAKASQSVRNDSTQGADRHRPDEDRTPRATRPTRRVADTPEPPGSPGRSTPRPDRDGAPNVDGGWSGPRFGAVYHGMWDMTWSDRAELLDKLASIGVRWVRIGMQWSLVQPDPPSADHGGWSTQWGVPKADRVINQAAQRGLQVSVTLLRTPDWANGGRGPEYLPSDPSTYARAVEWLAHRYRGRVDSWEIYNETNNENHLRASVADYVRLLCAAYPAVHRGDPSAKVVFGGTSGNDYEYIDAGYQNGAKGCFDVLATHPYNSNLSPLPEPPSDHGWWFRNIEFVRDVMLRYGDGATPVWFTELGWSTHANTSAMSSSELGVTPTQQAQYALQALRITKRDYPYVDRLAWYAARDETSSTVENNNFGLFTLDLEPKPAALALRGFFDSR
jgi:hypothetical protein